LVAAASCKRGASGPCRELGIAAGGGGDGGLQNLNRTVHGAAAEQRTGIRSIQAQAHLARGVTREKSEHGTCGERKALVDQVHPARIEQRQDAIAQAPHVHGLCGAGGNAGLPVDQLPVADQIAGVGEGRRPSAIRAHPFSSSFGRMAAPTRPGRGCC
jgi:hypothetical protein